MDSEPYASITHIKHDAAGRRIPLNAIRSSRQARPFEFFIYFTLHWHAIAAFGLSQSLTCALPGARDHTSRGSYRARRAHTHIPVPTNYHAPDLDRWNHRHRDRQKKTSSLHEVTLHSRTPRKFLSLAITLPHADRNEQPQLGSKLTQRPQPQTSHTHSHLSSGLETVPAI